MTKNRKACAPCEDADQPGHPPSLISVQSDHSLRCPLEESLDP